jgi:hypothetical protein
MEAAYIGFGFGIIAVLVVLVNKVTRLQDSLDEIKHLMSKSADQKSNWWIRGKLKAVK